MLDQRKPRTFIPSKYTCYMDYTPKYHPRNHANRVNAQIYESPAHKWHEIVHAAHLN